MKHALCCLLILCALCSLCACASPNTEGETGTTTVATTTAPVTATELTFTKLPSPPTKKTTVDKDEIQTILTHLDTLDKALVGELESVPAGWKYYICVQYSDGHDVNYTLTGDTLMIDHTKYTVADAAAAENKFDELFAAIDAPEKPYNA